MDRDELAIIIIAIIVLIFSGVIMFIARKHLGLIHDALLKQGAENILVSWGLFQSGRQTFTYLVEYDLEGQKHRRVCKVETRGTKIYWESEG